MPVRLVSLSCMVALAVGVSSAGCTPKKENATRSDAISNDNRQVAPEPLVEQASSFAEGDLAMTYMHIILGGFRVLSDGKFKLASMACGITDGTWRPRLTGVVILANIDYTPEQYEAAAASYYTMELHDSRLAKDRRYTRIMAYGGTGSILEAVATNKLGASSHPGVSRLFSIRSSDPLADAIVLLENKSSTTVWTKRGDIDSAPKTAEEIEKLGGTTGSFCVGFADGAVWRLSTKVPPNVLGLFLTVSGAEIHQREDKLEEYALGKWKRNSSVQPDSSQP